MSGNSALLGKVAEVYDWLDSQITASGDLVARCEACGKCCDFESFEHRLFVTPPELIYLAAKLETEALRPMVRGICPYNIDGKCSVYEYRFAGCRIFFCKWDADFQSTLSESALKRFKSLCMEFGIPYRYAELRAALNSCVGT
jgi:Fe-S-cluster containining protein